MSKRAEEAALKICPPMIVKDEDGSLDDLTYMARTWVQKGYELAEKDTVERAIAWLKEHVNEYIVDLTPTYPDAPVNIIVGGMCWEHLKDYLEDEECQDQKDQ